jgi:DNA-binding MarR family transcriptional regulator
MRHHPSINRVLSCLYRHTQMYYDRQLSRYNLGYGSLSFLMVLFHHDGIHQEEISRKLHIDKATTARAIQKLTAGEYVRREPDLSDRRAYRIFLTAKAIAFKPELYRLSSAWTRQLTTGFSEVERAQIFALLDKLALNARIFRTLPTSAD